MTTTEAGVELEQANICAGRVFKNALEMKAAASEIPASLQQVADCLKNMAAAPIQGDPSVLVPHLKLLQSRIRQIQLLLDSAAAFYCASISRARSIENESYTASGLPVGGHDVRHLQLEA